MTVSIDAILVPQGQEYQTVCRAIAKTSACLPIIPIPVGIIPARNYLKKWLESEDPQNSLTNFLLCGLCGSLSKNHKIGDIVVCQNYIYVSSSNCVSQLECEPELLTYLQEKVTPKPDLVKGLTGDRVICSALEKRDLNKKYRADVVDMEGFGIETILKETGKRRLGTIRVVSDDALQDLPNLADAIDEGGNLLPLPLAIAMLKKPLAAKRLIWGSLRSLQVLERVIIQLFS